MEIYRIEDLSFAFPLQEVDTLRKIRLVFRGGEFVTICGKSGSGKSTFLRQLKSILTPHGKRTGEVFYRGRAISDVDQRTQASEIGFVLQNPDNQIVTDKVWHELAFGLESLGCDQRTIRLRVAEMASFFGIQSWFHKRVSELSGGQKQLLNLASVMAMQPSVLILDEPTSQLDPIAAADFLGMIGKINRELGVTVLMTEHRLEEALPLSDRLIVMDEGCVLVDDTPAKGGASLRAMRHAMFAAMPSPMRIAAGAANVSSVPVTVKEGSRWLDAYLDGKQAARSEEKRPDGARLPRPVVIQCKEVWFRHERNGPDTIKDLSFEVEEGEFYCFVGGNGTGKTTTLSLLSGLLRPYRGTVRIVGRDPAKMKASELFANCLGMLPQHPTALFVKKTVESDLYEMLSDRRLSESEKRSKVEAVVRFAELEPFLSMHPYDLSGGEQQRAALAKVLLLEPKLLLLDEPTKGLDAFFKEKLGRFLKNLQSQGVTILMVSHDIEFCAAYGDRCAMFFDGSVAAEHEARTFFSGNSFYTTAANRMARHVWLDAVTTEGVIELCRRSEKRGDA